MQEDRIYRERFMRFQSFLQENEWEAALIMQPRDLFYFAATAQPANLWIPVTGEPVLFTRRAHDLTLEATWIKNTLQANSFREMMAILQEREMIPAKGILGIELDVLPYTLVENVKRSFHQLELRNISPAILTQRFIKDEHEINQIRGAVKLWSKGHQAIIKSLEPGKTECEIAAMWESVVRANGGEGTVWFRRWDACLPGGGIVSSGNKSWVISGHAMTVTGVGLSQALPWGASMKKIEKGDLMVMDFGLCYQGYHCDIARTYSIGKPTDEKTDLWNRLLHLHFEVIEQIKPGVTGHELYIYAESLARKMGMEDNFMGIGKQKGAYIGHSIGVELDEWPVLGSGIHEPILPGAVITIEPKFMVTGVGSVMVEDDILVTQDGYEILSNLGRELYYG